MSAVGWVGIAASVVLPLAIVAVVFGRIFRGMADRKALLQTGVRANARITDIRQTGTTLNNQPGCEIGLMITPTGGPPYAAKVTQFVLTRRAPAPHAWGRAHRAGRPQEPRSCGDRGLRACADDDRSRGG